MQERSVGAGLSGTCDTNFPDNGHTIFFECYQSV